MESSEENAPGCAGSRRKACVSKISDGKDEYRRGIPPVEMREMDWRN
jgi:hypothetical protein